VRFEETPNPNALKCLPARPIPPIAGKDGAMRSYASADAAAGDPLAKRLFAIPGVRNVLITREWLTVGKAPDAAWPPIKHAVKAALETPA